MSTEPVEYGKRLDWSRVSGDYAKHRKGYPESFFSLLKALGVGRSGQRILDLGTGTGALALPFAAQGARVTGLDRDPGQLWEAGERASALGLGVEWIESGAEDSGLPAASFDAVTASMCWGYFDKAKVVPEVLRLLVPGGLLAVTSLIWRAGDGDVVSRSNALIARYNPEFGGRHARQREEEDPSPDWARGAFTLKTLHRYTEALDFSHEQWRGRIRASKWIGAALPEEAVESFDREHAELLRFEPEPLRVDHRIRIRIFEAGS